MEGEIWAPAQPEAESLSLLGSQKVRLAAPVDELGRLMATEAAGRMALDRIRHAIMEAFPLRERVPPEWAAGLGRLGLIGRPVTLGQFQQLCLTVTNASYATTRLAEMALIDKHGGCDRRVREVSLSAAGAAWLERLRGALCP